MKTLILLFLFSPLLMFSQNIGIGTETPDNSAKLEITSDSSGILIPRLTIIQRNNITSPANGLLIYNSENGRLEFYNGTSWLPVSPATSDPVFKDEGGAISQKLLLGQDFIIGRDHLPMGGEIISENFMFFDKSKGAFRAGGTNNSSSWDQDSIGDYTFAFGLESKAVDQGSIVMGENNVARGYYSLAFGDDNRVDGNGSIAIGSFLKTSAQFAIGIGLSNNASGQYSIAIGRNAKASNNNAISIGYNTIASGQYAFAMGHSTQGVGTSSTATGYLSKALGDYSTAMGFNTEANKHSATALGSNTLASGNVSTALGYFTQATGNYATSLGYYSEANGNNSLSLGNNSIASGTYSTAIGKDNFALGNLSITCGNSVSAPSFGEIVIGQNNTPYTPNSQTAFVSTDRLFVVGNGINASSKSDAMVILKNGKTGIGTSSPLETLHLKGNLNIEGKDNDANLIMQSKIGTRNRIIVMQDNNANIYFGDLDGRNQDVIFRSNGTDRMIIKNNGNIGVGLSSPSYQLQLSSNSAAKPGSSSWTIISDRRLKQNIHAYQDGLDEILKINPVNFNYNQLSGNDTTVNYVGLIAQELQKVAPYMVTEQEDGYLTLDDGALTYMLINAVKDLNLKLDKKEHENKVLAEQIEILSSKIQHIENLMEANN